MWRLERAEKHSGISIEDLREEELHQLRIENSSLKKSNGLVKNQIGRRSERFVETIKLINDLDLIDTDDSEDIADEKPKSCLRYRIPIGIFSTLVLYIFAGIFFYEIWISTPSELNPSSIDSYENNILAPDHFNISELNICNSPFKYYSVRCKGDASCVKCLSDADGLFTLRDTIWSKEVIGKIRDYVHKRFGPPGGNKTIILITADEKYMVYVELLKFSSTKLNLTYTNLLVGTLTQQSVEEGRKKGLTEIMPVWWECPGCKTAFYAKNLQMHLLFVLFHLGYNVIQQDVDVVWVRDPRPHLMKMIAENNPSFLSTRAKFKDFGMGPINSGFIYFFHHKDIVREKMILKFLATVSFAAPLIDVTKRDQRIWNEVLRHNDFQVLQDEIHWLKRSLMMDSHCQETTEMHTREAIRNVLTYHITGSKFLQPQLTKLIKFKHKVSKIIRWMGVLARKGDYNSLDGHSTYKADEVHPCDNTGGWDKM